MKFKNSAESMTYQWIRSEEQRTSGIEYKIEELLYSDSKKKRKAITVTTFMYSDI
jgi:hypothetical protein